MIDDIKKFMDKYSIQNIIELTLIIIIGYLLSDMFDIPTYLANRFETHIVFFAFLVFIMIFNRICYCFFKINVSLYIDLFLFIIFGSTFCYLVYTYLFSYTLFKSILLTIVFNVTIVLMIIRLIRLYNKKQNINNMTNVYDLKQLYNNEISDRNDEIIFLLEKDVDYDLLNRETIITDLYNSIYYCNNTKKFVISLTGKWGSGKTTIINIVKKNLPTNKFIIIDDFDVWKYSNDKATIYGMFDKIMDKIGVKFSLLEIKNFIDLCTSIISSGAVSNINLFSSESQKIKRIRNTINEYLISNDKRVVFIIDNLERTNCTNIISIIRTISTILDFDKFIYILSYDEKEMKQVFEKQLQINYDYMEKIVQLPLKVPEISKEDILNICNRCMENILKHYGISNDEIKEYSDAIILFNENIKNLRVFKRRVNSLLNSNFYNDNYLNRGDLFLLELIHDENIDLYEKIRTNYKYFVSEDQSIMYGYDFENPKTYNEKATDFFKYLFEGNNYKYKNILSKIFPNVKKFEKEYNINTNDRVQFRDESSFILHRDKEKYAESVVKRRIYNARFFELYFTRHQNVFIEIDESIKSSIEYINRKVINVFNERDMQRFCSDLGKKLDLYNNYKQKYIFEMLEMHLSEITKNKLLLLVFLIAQYESVDDTLEFLLPNSIDRLAILCAEIIKTLSKENIKMFKEIMKKSIKRMVFIRHILYWLNPKEKIYSEGLSEELYDDLKTWYNLLIRNVIERKINLYEEENYGRKNIYCLLESEEGFEYMKENVDSNTVYMFLADVISNSYGTKGYGYEIDWKTFNKFVSVEYIDLLLEKNKNIVKTSLEQFVENVYYNSKKNKNDNTISDTRVYTNVFVDLRKINKKNN